MLRELLGKLDVWFAMGMVAQVLFGARFLIQWYVSERAGSSVIPISFWYLSIAGGLGLLLYAIVRQDPLFILAYSLNNVIYVRNLMLIHRKRPSGTA